MEKPNRLSYRGVKPRKICGVLTKVSYNSCYDDIETNEEKEAHSKMNDIVGDFINKIQDIGFDPATLRISIRRKN